MKSNISAHIAVIGGGAAGLAAAIFAARKAEEYKKQVKITVYEGNSRVGKKLLVTGNGRCNFTNEVVLPEHFYGESELAFSVYSQFDNKKTVEFFESIGLFSKADAAHRVYPMSMQASSVSDCLRFELQRLNIVCQTDCKIISLKKEKNGFLLNGKFFADKVIFCTGGKAAPVHGSDGSGYKLLEELGVQIAPPFPALTALVCRDFPKGLKGIRAQGTLTLKDGGCVLSQKTGEIQYTDYGLSGIPAMQVSRFASSSLAQKHVVRAVVDSCPSYSFSQLEEKFSALVKTNPSMTAQLLLSGIMPKRLGDSILSSCSVGVNTEIGKLHVQVIKKIVDAVKNSKYTVEAVKGFNDAQVTGGGVVAEEIVAETLELKKVKGMYVCGEVVNVDGDCGGYNLQWAWSSAAVAATNLIGEI